MMTLKGIIVGSLLFLVVEVILLVRSLPPRPPGEGVVGYDVVTTLHNLNDPLGWITLIVFISICSRFFQK